MFQRMRKDHLLCHITLSDQGLKPLMTNDDSLRCQLFSQKSNSVIEETQVTAL